MDDLQQIQEFFNPPAGVNTAYRVTFTRIENKEVVKDFELFKDPKEAKLKFNELKSDPFMGSIKIEKIYGGQSGDGDRYLGGSEEIERYSNPVNDTKSSELTPEEQDIKTYMNTPSFISAKRGFQEKEDLMSYLGRMKKATSEFVNSLEEGMSKAGIMRQIKDAEEILDSGYHDEGPLDMETEMLVQQELARLKKMLASLGEGKLTEGKLKEAIKNSIKEMDINDPILVKLRADKAKRANQAYKPDPKPAPIRKPRALDATNLTLDAISDLKAERAQIMSDMEQEAELEGGPIADAYADRLEAIDTKIAQLRSRLSEGMEANDFVATVNDEFDLETLNLMKKVIDDRIEMLQTMVNTANPRTQVKGYKRYDEIAETIKFIKENNPSATVEEIVAELKEIKELGEVLEEKLCKKGEAYRKRRMAAGEKSSAYLSGRAVKVCKGSISGRSKRKKRRKKRKKRK